LRLSSLRARTGIFALLALLAMGVWWKPLNETFALSLRTGYGSYAVLIPLFVLYMLWSRRQHIFSDLGCDFALGLPTIVAGITVAAFTLSSAVPTIDRFLTLELRFLALLLSLLGIFLLVFGRRPMGRALFPFFLLGLSLPLPASVADGIIATLQSSSTTAADFLFSLFGVPVFRDGFLLHIPGVTIEVAKECSGINSSMALVFTLLLVGYETLQTASRRFVLVLLAIPLSIAKNAVRIVTLTLLAVHVDMRFLTGSFHHKGGIVFYLLGLAALYPFWKLLQRSENRKELRTKKSGLREFSPAVE